MQYFEDQNESFKREVSESYSYERGEINVACVDFEYFEYFKMSYNILLDIYFNRSNIPNKNIKEIFCITYCNYILENFVRYLEYFYYGNNFYEIINFLKEDNTKIKEAFKLFILKEIKMKYIQEKKSFFIF